MMCYESLDEEGLRKNMGKLKREDWKPRNDIVRERKKRGWSQEELAEKVGDGCKQSVIQRLETGETERSRYLERVEAILELKKSSRMVPVVGYVGAGAVIWPVEGQTGDAMISEVPAPPEGYSSSLVAVRVEGDSMQPQYEKGAYLYYDGQKKFFDHLLGKTLIVRVSDGRSYIKKLLRGSEPGRYTLFSYNGTLIENVEVEWVAEIEWVRPPK